MVLPAAERTTQILAVDVPGVSQKTNPAVSAGNDTILQFGMRPEGRLQREQILPD
jgi:hypothetical protein